VGRGGGLFGLLVGFDGKSLRFRKLDDMVVEVISLFGDYRMCSPRMLLRVRVCLSVCLVLYVTVSYVDVDTFEVVVLCCMESVGIEIDMWIWDLKHLPPLDLWIWRVRTHKCSSSSCCRYRCIQRCA
jgi:hypothetical protein